MSGISDKQDQVEKGEKNLIPRTDLSLSLPDPAYCPPVFLIIPTDRELGIGYK